mgnify:CR=1 FL=1
MPVSEGDVDGMRELSRLLTRWRRDGDAVALECAYELLLDSEGGRRLALVLLVEMAGPRRSSV